MDTLPDMGLKASIRKGHLPLVIAQLGQSLDGRIATLSGDSKYINGPAALDHLHRLRALVDAVVVGVGTVAADDPLLTVRRVKGESPARVVIDPSGRMDPAARCLTPDGVRRLVLRRAGVTAPLPEGVEVIEMEAEGPFAPHAVLKALAQQGFSRILLEGGARTVSAFLDARAVDHLHVLVAPMILGSGRSGLDLSPIGSVREALRPEVRVHGFAEGDVLFACDFTGTAREGRHGDQDGESRSDSSLCGAG